MTEAASNDWAARPLAERVRVICRLRHVLAADPRPFLDTLKMPFRRSPVESLAAEIIPFADACHFLERNAANILRPRRLGRSGRPAWLLGTDAEIHREPLGTVLIIGPGNYPLMLPGIQLVQALVAGNRVVWKPAPGSKPVAQCLTAALAKLGVPEPAMVVLDEAPEAIRPWLGQVDKVVLTGSRRTGLALARDLAGHLTPAVMELSGCDPAIVLADADLNLVARCIRFGLEFNGSASCIAPRRLLVHQSAADTLVTKLREELVKVPPISVAAETRMRLDEVGQAAVRAGVRLILGELPCGEAFQPLVFDHARPHMTLLQDDFMAPVTSIIRVASTEEALDAARSCPYRLGASVFGSVAAAREVALRIDAGSVVVNDLIVPTVDPRLPFGGSAGSGFGVTRGAEGLLEMTKIKAISVQKHGPRLHHLTQDERTGKILHAQLVAAHGGAAWRKGASAARLLCLLAHHWFTAGRKV